MIIINAEKCIGCSQCVRDCFPVDIELAGGKAVAKNDKCFECGHCVAVCPVEAITLDGYDMSEVREVSEMNGKIDPEVYLDHLRMRRSMRHYKKQQLTREQVDMILEAGRISPTGGNRQNVTYHVIQDRIDDFKPMIIDQLKKMGDAMISQGKRASFYTDMWLDMYDDFHENGKDRIFFDAPVAIVVSSDDPMAAGIAVAHMESMIYAMDLGMLYSGFSKFAIETSEEIQKELGMKEGYHAQAVLVVGYPDVKYRRNVPRKKAEVTYL